MVEFDVSRKNLLEKKTAKIDHLSSTLQLINYEKFAI